MNYLVKRQFGSKQYLGESGWIDQPRGRINGARYLFGERNKELVNLAGVWRYIKEKSIESAPQPDNIIKKLADLKFKNQNLSVFIPWGPRYNKTSPIITAGDAELATLNELRDSLSFFNNAEFPIDLLIMPADVYAKEINTLSSDFVDSYFTQLEYRVQEYLSPVANITISPWSEIRATYADRYNELRKDVTENFEDRIDPLQFLGAIKAAKFFNPKKAEQSARAYCIERFVEGFLINEVYEPVKMSLVRKEKDALDGPLQRIYIVENRAPWLCR